ncbi:MAG: SGNH/GDSL hydrolase family protein, partial [Saprospiraceae bacterium]|nr:SGNH/GDSL hydrolase family protein [Saprospiraceae bacterium]
INQKIAKLAKGKNIKFADADSLFLQKDKKINEALFTDGLHPNEAGYERLGSFIVRKLEIF